MDVHALEFPPDSENTLGKEDYPLGILNQKCMKLKRNDYRADKAVLTITKREWIRIGQDAGWEVPDDLPEDDSGNESEAYPMPDIQVKKYGESFFGVYIDGELLVVAVYKKGAIAVKEFILGMYAGI